MEPVIASCKVLGVILFSARRTQCQRDSSSTVSCVRWQCYECQFCEGLVREIHRWADSVDDVDGQGWHSAMTDELAQKSRQSHEWRTSFHGLRFFWWISSKFQGLVYFEVSQKDWVTTEDHTDKVNNYLDTLTTQFLGKRVKKLVPGYETFLNLGSA